MICNTGSASVATTRRRGFTLLELLVAMTLTLLLTALVVQVFTFVSDGVFNSRATMDLADQLRNAKHRLIQDLRGITAPTTPPLDPSAESGYFEYVEGPWVANYPGGDIGRPQVSLTNSRQTYFGDLDDILMFTTVNFDEEFVGKGSNGAIKSRYAEVMYFLKPIANTTNTTHSSTEYFTLHRRVSLVGPSSGWGEDQSMYPERGPNENLTANTVVADPVDPTGTGATRPQVSVGGSLGDLTMRERRRAHDRYQLPYDPAYRLNNGGTAFSIADANWPTGNPYVTLPSLNQQDTDREQNDIILTNVVGFDIKAWDPGAPVFRATPGTAAGSNANIVGLIVPGDPGYGGDGSSQNNKTIVNPTGALQGFISGTANARPVSFGAYADLNYMWINNAGGPYNDQRRANYMAALLKYEKDELKCGLGTLPRPSFGFANPRNWVSGYSPVNKQYPAVYDTWSRHYEYDGWDNDRDGFVDEGDNGIDDNRNGFIDEPDLDLDGDGIPESNGETDAPPPYAAPLRGIKITIRVMEQDSRQVREVTIIHEFVPL